MSVKEQLFNLEILKFIGCSNSSIFELLVVGLVEAMTLIRMTEIFVQGI